MIVLLCNWLYLFVTSFVVGFCALRFCVRKTGYQFRSMNACVLAGIVLFTVYAQIFSLFHGVGLLANVILCITTIVLAVFNRKAIWIFLQERYLGRTWYWWVACTGLVLLFSYGASRGYMHFDTGLYHAQSIRWIEEYGVVPGLGNLHSRFAYNSAAFPLTALFSMKFLIGQSLHGVAGFLALLSALEAFKVLGVFRGRKVLVSDFARTGLLYYLFIIYTEMVSPASDYFSMLMVFFIIIKWIDLEEKEEKNVIPYALLSLCIVFAVTLKLSTAILLLLVIKPAAMLLKDKKGRQIIQFLFMGCIILMPYLIRNVLISGWLLYPFTFLDLFSPDWKMEKGYADSDAKEIQVYAKLIYDVYLFDTPITGWYQNWFEQLKGLEKVWIIGGIASLPAGMIAIITDGIQAVRGKGILLKSDLKKGTLQKNIVLLELTLIISFLLWQNSAPLIRYGYAYVILLPMVTVGYFYVRFLKEEAGKKIFSVILLLFLLYKGYHLGISIVAGAGQNYYFTQQDYTSCATDEYRVGGVTIYVPLESGQIGYDKFPSSPVVQDIELRGSSLSEGFRRSSR